MFNYDNTNRTVANDPNLALCASDLKLGSLVPDFLSNNFRSGSSLSPLLWEEELPPMVFRVLSEFLGFKKNF